MLSSLIIWLQSIVIPLGAFGVFFGSITEEVIAFIPSALMQMAFGFLLFNSVPVTALSFLHFILIVVIPTALGVAVGAIPLYYLARAGGMPFVNRFGKYLDITSVQIETWKIKFEKNKTDKISIFIFRVLPFVPSVIVCVVCGLLRTSLKTYVIYTFLGTLIRALIYGFVGWQLGRAYESVADRFVVYEKYVMWGLVLVGVVFVGWMLWRKYRKRYSDKQIDRI